MTNEIAIYEGFEYFGNDLIYVDSVSIDNSQRSTAFDLRLINTMLRDCRGYATIPIIKQKRTLSLISIKQNNLIEKFKEKWPNLNLMDIDWLLTELDIKTKHNFFKKHEYIPDYIPQYLNKFVINIMAIKDSIVSYMMQTPDEFSFQISNYGRQSYNFVNHGGCELYMRKDVPGKYYITKTDLIELFTEILQYKQKEDGFENYINDWTKRLMTEAGIKDDDIKVISKQVCKVNWQALLGMQFGRYVRKEDERLRKIKPYKKQPYKITLKIGKDIINKLKKAGANDEYLFDYIKHQISAIVWHPNKHNKSIKRQTKLTRICKGRRTPEQELEHQRKTTCPKCGGNKTRYSKTCHNCIDYKGKNNPSYKHGKRMKPVS